MPTTLSAFSGIAERYDGFIFDVWGTLYDGGSAFPDALATVERLAGEGKKLLVLSNSPRVPDVVAERLTGIGFDLSWFSGIVTSGGMVADIVGGRRDEATRALGERVLWLGRGRFPDALPEGAFAEVEDAAEADWILNAGPENPDSQIEDFEGVLTAGAERDLPMVCANPDKSVFHRGARQICAGAMAERYEALGGQVRYFGKPFPEIFDRCLERLALPAGRVLVVGDNLETDILGSNRSGIDSLLLGGGIHAGDLGGAADPAPRLDELMAEHGARPTYFAGSLAW
ncbi:TIGR01459 family HAD-type hydrolase [Nisaea acidiphila]|uniref:TIGR01459 family HAD-type hydrolase n=1 Tax=Nisaea acidiphila TaxID=1862145 RepID=A0A9J7AZ04_9PROT|nr:TIGR01459 family HAD-type hydrolase [Nisaea acidiphila]UUX51665.1 TIGR01459 family HAD-type hydrolase [Nisaea acidiphila]